jgi:K+-transporting ATPase A subunit
VAIKTILAVLISLTFGAICFGAGVFTTSFNQNMCYSSAQKAASSSDSAAFKNWANFVSNLPLQGYESNCEEIFKHVKAGAPHE